jgi:hypothetical protein
MKSQLYWALQHLKGGTQDLRFAVRCWWLTQQIGFLEWQWKVDAVVPQSVPQPVPVVAPRARRYALHQL